MKLITLKKVKRALLLLTFCLTASIIHGQSVSTLIDDFPGDGEMSLDDEGHFLYINDSGSVILNGTTVLKVDTWNDYSYEIFRDDLDPFVVGSIFNANGDLLVTGWSSGTITRLLTDGTKVPFESGINGAGSLEVDENGNVYVAEFSDNRVVRFDANGNNRVDFSIGSPILNPAGLAYVAATQKLYVSNWMNGKISEVDSNGNATPFAELFPSTPNAGPIKISPDGQYMYVTSPMHHVIYRIEMANPQNVELFAGIINVPGHEDGPVDIATFDTPTGLAFDGDETMYVTENFNDNGRLRIITIPFIGIEDNDSTNLGLTVSPNPTNDILRVQYDLSKGEVAQWIIFDVQGRRIDLSSAKFNPQGAELNIESLSPGMYFLKAISANAGNLGTTSFIKK